MDTRPSYNAKKRMEEWLKETGLNDQVSKVYSVMELRQLATETYEKLKELADRVSKYYPLIFPEDTTTILKFDDTLGVITKICQDCDLLVNEKTK